MNGDSFTNGPVYVKGGDTNNSVRIIGSGYGNGACGLSWYNNETDARSDSTRKAYIYAGTAGTTDTNLYLSGSGIVHISSGSGKDIELAPGNGGNVGIGTSSPSEKLHVAGGSIYSAPTSDHAIKIYKNGFVGITWYNTSGNTSTNRAGYIQCYTTDDSTTYPGMYLKAERGHINLSAPNGNVGIGTTSPSEKLDVNGNIKATKFYGDGSSLTGISGGSSVWTSSNNNIYYNSGYVGIGTTPSEKLHVDGTTKTTDLNVNSKLKIDNNGSYLKFTLFDMQNYPFYDVALNGTTQRFKLPLTGTSSGYYTSFHVSSTGDPDLKIAGDKVSVKNDLYLAKNVGIGTTPNSSYKLDVSGNIRGSSVYTSNYYYSSSSMYIQAGYGNNMYFQTNGVIRQTINTSGHVGIGPNLTNPDYPLHITGTRAGGNVNVGGTAYWHYGSTGLGYANASNDRVVVKIESGGIWLSYVHSYIYNSSDSRIKTNIEDVPDNLALEQLRNIPCRYYEYIDKMNSRNNEKTIGFIAQEVKSVLPMAVSQQKQIIPNIYKIINCTWTSNIDKFSMSSTDLTNVNGVKYKFYVSNASDGSDEKCVEVTGNSDNTFTFDCQYTNVFCYGSEVDDFHILDKNKLFTLNFSATQEIDRIQQTHITKIETLESKVSKLETENATLKSIIDKLTSATSFDDFKSKLSI